MCICPSIYKPFAATVSVQSHTTIGDPNPIIDIANSDGVATDRTSIEFRTGRGSEHVRVVA